jgi:uncharacterized membrane protein
VSETKRSGLSDNGIAALAYITFIPAIIFLILPRYNRSAYVRFHAWQSLLLNIAAFVLSVILTFLVAPFVMSWAVYMLDITWAIWAIWLGMWVVCAIAALNGKLLKIPLLGTLAEKQANAGK